MTDYYIITDLSGPQTNPDGFELSTLANICTIVFPKMDGCTSVKKVSLPIVNRVRKPRNQNKIIYADNIDIGAPIGIVELLRLKRDNGIEVSNQFKTFCINYASYHNDIALFDQVNKIPIPIFYGECIRIALDKKHDSFLRHFDKNIDNVSKYYCYEMLNGIQSVNLPFVIQWINRSMRDRGDSDSSIRLKCTISLETFVRMVNAIDDTIKVSDLNYVTNIDSLVESCFKNLDTDIVKKIPDIYANIGTRTWMEAIYRHQAVNSLKLDSFLDWYHCNNTNFNLDSNMFTYTKSTIRYAVGILIKYNLNFSINALKECLKNWGENRLIELENYGFVFKFTLSEAKSIGFNMEPDRWVNSHITDDMIELCPTDYYQIIIPENMTVFKQYEYACSRLSEIIQFKNKEIFDKAVDICKKIDVQCDAVLRVQYIQKMTLEKELEQRTLTQKIGTIVMAGVFHIYDDNVATYNMLSRRLRELICQFDN